MLYFPSFKNSIIFKIFNISENNTISVDTGPWIGPKGKEGKKERKKARKQYFCVAAIRTLCWFNIIVEQLFLIGHTKSFVQIVLFN